MPTFEQTAYFFVYHGSRDPRPQASAQRLSRQVVRVLLDNHSGINRSGSHHSGTNGSAEDDSAPHNSTNVDQWICREESLLFSVGALELASIPLHEHINQFGHRIAHQGITTIRIIPLFLFPGVHVAEDIPEEVHLAQHRLGHSIHLICCPHMGSHHAIANYLRTQLSAQTPLSSTSTCIFISHGSKKPRANEPAEAIAAQLGARMAYWSMPPSLAECLDDLIIQGCTDIMVIPYFLFGGKITDTIAQTVQDYRHRFPQIRIHLGHPLGESEAIAPLIAELAASPSINADTILA